MELNSNKIGEVTSGKGWFPTDRPDLRRINPLKGRCIKHATPNGKNEFWHSACLQEKVNRSELPKIYQIGDETGNRIAMFGTGAVWVF